MEEVNLLKIFLGSLALMWVTLVRIIRTMRKKICEKKIFLSSRNKPLARYLQLCLGN